MVFPALAVGAGVAAGATNIWSQHQANKQKKKAIKKATGYYLGLKDEQALAGKQALAELGLARTDLLGGFKRARGQIGGAFRSQQVDALDREQQTMAAIERDMISSGRWSSTALDSARMGMQHGTSRVMVDIASRAAAALAQLEQNRGLALAGQRGAVASQIGQNFAGRAAITQDLANIALGAGATSQQDYSNEIGWLFGAIDDLFAPSTGAGGTFAAEDDPFANVDFPGDSGGGSNIDWPWN